MIEGGVAPGTAQNYARSYDRWKLFMTERGEADFFMHACDEKEKVTLLCLFMKRTADMGHTVEAEMAGIHHAFRCEVADTNIFANKAIMAAKKSFAPNPREVSLRKEVSRRIPLPFEVVRLIRREFWEAAYAKSDPLLSRMIYLGVAIGYAATRRISEYAHASNTKNKHALRWEDVFLTDSTGRSYPGYQRGNIGEPAVVSVRMEFRSSKNGATTFHLDGNADILAAQFVGDIVAWCQLSLEKEPSDLFLSRVMNGRRKLITSKLINEALKDAGVTLGLEESRISSHGLRYGGCASMKAAGHSVQEVQGCSGHRSKSCAILYMGSSVHDPNPLGVASKGEGFSLEDAMRLLPRKDIINGVGFKRIREV